jgi:Protein of unknown function (DUF3040)
MALSMDEQRMLAEIERRLTAEDPGLAARLSSFKRPGPGARLRSPRTRIIGSILAVGAALALSMMIYAMIPFRAHAPKDGVTNPQATGGVSASAPAKPGQKPATGSSSTPATASAPGTSTITSGAVKSNSAAKTGTGQAGTSAATSGTHSP